MQIERTYEEVITELKRLQAIKDNIHLTEKERHDANIRYWAIRWAMKWENGIPEEGEVKC